jgi:hypothetical protein
VGGGAIEAIEDFRDHSVVMPGVSFVRIDDETPDEETHRGPHEDVRCIVLAGCVARAPDRCCESSARGAQTEARAGFRRRRDQRPKEKAD